MFVLLNTILFWQYTTESRCPRHPKWEPQRDNFFCRLNIFCLHVFGHYAIYLDNGIGLYRSFFGHPYWFVILLKAKLENRWLSKEDITELLNMSVVIATIIDITVAQPSDLLETEKKEKTNPLHSDHSNISWNGPGHTCSY